MHTPPRRWTLDALRRSATEFKAKQLAETQAWIRRNADTVFAPTEFVINDDYQAYHLTISEVAPYILLVGDPGRAEFIGKTFLKSGSKVSAHRGLYTVTGETKKNHQRVTVCTSGMGTPSEEIVLNELFGVANIDLRSRMPREALTDLSIVRVGTSGGIQPGTGLGMPIIAEYSVGLDNTGLLYEVGYQDEFSPILEGLVEEAIRGTQSTNSRSYGKIHPYVSHSDPETTAALISSAEKLGVGYKLGITATNSGFFANQGRSVSPIPLAVPDIDLVLAAIQTGVEMERGQFLQFENLEMESSFLFHYLMGLGMSAGCICTTVADRRENRWAENISESIEQVIEIGLDALALLAQR